MPPQGIDVGSNPTRDTCGIKSLLVCIREALLHHVQGMLVCHVATCGNLSNHVPPMLTRSHPRTTEYRNSAVKGHEDWRVQWTLDKLKA